MVAADRKPDFLTMILGPRMKALATKAEKSNSLEHILAANLLHSLSVKTARPEYYTEFLTKYLEAHAKKPKESQFTLATILQLMQLEAAEAKKKQEGAAKGRGPCSDLYPSADFC